MAVAAPPEHEQPPELEMNAEPVDEAREYAIASRSASGSSPKIRSPTSL